MTPTITLPRATVEQALEALELGYDSAKSEADQYHAAMAGFRPERHAQMDADVQQIAAAITALRAALAQQQQQAEQTWVCPDSPEHRYAKPGHCEDCGKTLVLAQPNPPGCDHCNHPLYAATKCRVCGRVTEQAEPVEPVAWLYEAGTDRTLHWYKPPLHGTPLYTSPPQRKPLTEEEIFAIENDIPDDVVGDRAWTIWFARAVERAHGIGGQDDNANS